jgi:cytolysin-activating lysine-acyltransferase
MKKLQMNTAESVGHIVSLCALKGIYLEWTIRDVARLFIPPVLAGQCKLYFAGPSCTAFATWAFLSDEWSERLQGSFEDPDSSAWSSGSNVWIIDVVAPGVAIQVARDLQRTVFRHETTHGFALRRDESGKVRNIALFPCFVSTSKACTGAPTFPHTL